MRSGVLLALSRLRFSHSTASDGGQTSRKAPSIISSVLNVTTSPRIQFKLYLKAQPSLNDYPKVLDRRSVPIRKIEHPIDRFEPSRVFRRPLGLSYAAMSDCSSMA